MGRVKISGVPYPEKEVWREQYHTYDIYVMKGSVWKGEKLFYCWSGGCSISSEGFKTLEEAKNYCITYVEMSLKEDREKLIRTLGSIQDSLDKIGEQQNK